MDAFGQPKRIEYTVSVNAEGAVVPVNDVCHVIRELCGQDGWEGVEDEQVQVVVLQGGITNQLYKANHGDKSVLVRVYGRNTEVLIDRDEEEMIFHILSEKQFGPKLYGIFENGRVEGFIPCQEVTPEDMGKREPVDFVKLIATELARMHHLDMPLSREPHLWSFLRKFQTKSLGISFPDNAEKQSKLDSLHLEKVHTKLEELSSMLPCPDSESGLALINEKKGISEGEKLAREFLFETVFCHNDLLAGNVLYLAPSSRAQFIDFEYGKYNYRGFDFANHFCEYAGFDFDLEKWYPSAAKQEYFVRSYITALSNIQGDERAKILESRLDEDPVLATEFFASCFAWTHKFASASNLMWGYWALVQELYSAIDFDYLDYARLRFAGLSP